MGALPAAFCGVDAVDQFYGPTSVCIGFNLSLRSSQRRPVSETNTFFLLVFNISFGTAKIYKEIHEG